ncbi:DUF4097 domain-containing protein [Nocardia sp. NPDC060256]|uniref:DUF4097 family beta strand repeat-containing protein n=1 Tax=unclassified Nocardia TaxID=2637762 RepID=UPI003657155F
MPVFETPEPISLTVEIGIGDIRLHAGQRTNTVVEVNPSDRDSEEDVKFAEQTAIDFEDGELIVRAPKHRGFFAKGGSIDVEIDLPSGSDFSGAARESALRCTGRLGGCRFKTSTGDIELAEAGLVDLSTTIGDITVDRVGGTAEATTGSGTVRIRELVGAAVLKNSNGPISVDKAHASLEARTASGDIRVAEVMRGSIVVSASIGQLDIGVRAGTAALLDVRSVTGNIHNFMTPADGPGAASAKVEIRATTTTGDVAIRRV